MNLTDMSSKNRLHEINIPEIQKFTYFPLKLYLLKVPLLTQNIIYELVEQKNLDELVEIIKMLIIFDNKGRLEKLSSSAIGNEMLSKLTDTTIILNVIYKILKANSSVEGVYAQ